MKTHSILFIIAGGDAAVVDAENDSRHVFLVKIGDELLEPLVAIEINSVFITGIVVEDFRCDFRFGTAAKNDFKDPHKDKGKITWLLCPEHRCNF